MTDPARLPPSLIERRDTLARLVQVQLRHRLDPLMLAAFEAGEDSVRRQWDQMVQAIPEDARDAYAAGLWQAILIAQEVRDARGTPQEIVDRLMACSVFQTSTQPAKE